MKTHFDYANLNNKCRSLYIKLAKEFLYQGIHSEQIDKSLNELSFRDGHVSYLKPKAYEPTGIALGSPLPNRIFANLLWRISRLTDNYFSTISSYKDTTLALVPKDWYHITLVNRTHYEYSDIMLMSHDERVRALKVIKGNLTDTIKIFFSGLLLTRSGRLIVLGFPCNNQLYELRAKLANNLPELRVNLPNTVHIKLGHLLFNLKDEQLFSVINWLFRCSLHINHVLSFDDFYAPHGRIVP